MLLRFLVISAKFSVPDDKTVLCDIRRRPTLLADLCARTHRDRARHAVPGWIVDVDFWYFGFVSPRRRARAESAAGFCWPDSVRGLSVVSLILVLRHAPCIHRILFIRRIVQIWYARKGNAEGESLLQFLSLPMHQLRQILEHGCVVFLAQRAHARGGGGGCA
jgi:hypothetical protein